MAEHVGKGPRLAKRRWRVDHSLSLFLSTEGIISIRSMDFGGGMAPYGGQQMAGQQQPPPQQQQAGQAPAGDFSAGGMAMAAAPGYMPPMMPASMPGPPFHSPENGAR